jgi:hypothetical protein
VAASCGAALDGDAAGASDGGGERDDCAARLVATGSVLYPKYASIVLSLSFLLSSLLV